jgi:hypothetical protein
MGGTEPLPTPYAGKARCLKCLKIFESRDPRSNRICPPCSGKANHGAPKVCNTRLVEYELRGFEKDT